MPSRRKTPDEEPQTPRRPATTADERESQLIVAAVDLAEQQIQAGTASAQVVTHFLKLGSSRERLEQDRLRGENILLQAKAEAMETQKKIEVLYKEALDAMRVYQGQGPPRTEDD